MFPWEITTWLNCANLSKFIFWTLNIKDFLPYEETIREVINPCNMNDRQELHKFGKDVRKLYSNICLSIKIYSEYRLFLRYRLKFKYKRFLNSKSNEGVFHINRNSIQPPNMPRNLIRWNPFKLWCSWYYNEQMVQMLQCIKVNKGICFGIICFKWKNKYCDRFFCVNLFLLLIESQQS